MSSGAAAFIFDDAGLLLVVKENYGKFRWSLPGGMVDPGEVPQDAVVREVLEETGTTVEVNHLVGIYRLDDGFEAYAFRCTIANGEPAIQPTDELTDVEWMDPAVIPEPRSNLLHYALADAIEDRRGVVRNALLRVN